MTIEVESPSIVPDQEVKRGPGRPRKPIHESAHQPAHTGQVLGRDGEILARTRTHVGDQFEIDPAIIPEGWAYQWNTHTVHGNADVTRNLNVVMHANGWRAVPAERHPGVFTEHGHKGAIIVDGMRLEERPVALVEQAQYEDQKKAYMQMKDRDEALMGHKANLARSIPGGFELRNDARANQGRQTRLSMDTALDGFAPRPRHQLAEPGE